MLKNLLILGWFANSTWSQSWLQFLRPNLASTSSVLNIVKRNWLQSRSQNWLQLSAQKLDRPVAAEWLSVWLSVWSWWPRLPATSEAKVELVLFGLISCFHSKIECARVPTAEPKHYSGVCHISEPPRLLKPLFFQMCVLKWCVCFPPLLSGRFSFAPFFGQKLKPVFAQNACRNKRKIIRFEILFL